MLEIRCEPCPEELHPQLESADHELPQLIVLPSMIRNGRSILSRRVPNAARSCRTSVYISTLFAKPSHLQLPHNALVKIFWARIRAQSDEISSIDVLLA